MPSALLIAALCLGAEPLDSEPGKQALEPKEQDGPQAFRDTLGWYSRLWDLS
jgi:hypothetical protein